MVLQSYLVKYGTIFNKKEFIVYSTFNLSKIFGFKKIESEIYKELITYEFNYITIYTPIYEKRDNISHLFKLGFVIVS
jgi:hypothetical protein